MIGWNGITCTYLTRHNMSDSVWWCREMVARCSNYIYIAISIMFIHVCSPSESLQSFKTEIAVPDNFLEVPSLFITQTSQVQRLFVSLLHCCHEFSLNKLLCLNDFSLIKICANIFNNFQCPDLFFFNFGDDSRILKEEISPHSPVTRCSPHILTIIATTRWRWRWWRCWSITNGAERTTLAKRCEYVGPSPNVLWFSKLVKFGGWWFIVKVYGFWLFVVFLPAFSYRFWNPSESPPWTGAGLLPSTVGIQNR